MNNIFKYKNGKTTDLLYFLNPNNNRRTSERFVVSEIEPVDLLINDLQIPLELNLINISESGLLLECWSKLSYLLFVIRHNLKIRYKTNKQRISTNVTFVRLSKLEKKCHFQIGLKLIDWEQNTEWKQWLEKYYFKSLSPQAWMNFEESKRLNDSSAKNLPPEYRSSGDPFNSHT